MAPSLKAPARFTPLQTASPGRRLLALDLGPVPWIAAIVVVRAFCACGAECGRSRSRACSRSCGWSSGCPEWFV